MSTLETVAQPHDTISQCAADFFQRRRFWAWSDADQAELEAWLAERSAHRVAYLRVEGIVARTEQLAALRPPKSDAISNPIASDVTRDFRLQRYVLSLLAAASVALFAALGIPYAISLMQPPDHELSTTIGDHTLLSFADGTQVELNSDSAIRYRMTTDERTVWLEKGEAWFHVAHNVAHPFSVVVGRHRVSDLGTEFLVRRRMDGAEVLLMNGLAALSTDGAQTVRLETGDDAIATPVSMQVTRKTPQQLADDLAWRKGMLVFRNTPLAEVVRQFDRYNTTKLVIADPSVASETITADLRTDDFDTFLRLAKDVLNLHIDRRGSVILISRGSREEMKSAVHLKRSL